MVLYVHRNHTAYWGWGEGKGEGGIDMGEEGDKFTAKPRCLSDIN